MKRCRLAHASLQGSRELQQGRVCGVEVERALSHEPLQLASTCTALPRCSKKRSPAGQPCRRAGRGRLAAQGMHAGLGLQLEARAGACGAHDHIARIIGSSCIARCPPHCQLLTATTTAYYAVNLNVICRSCSSNMHMRATGESKGW